MTDPLPPPPQPSPQQPSPPRFVAQCPALGGPVADGAPALADHYQALHVLPDAPPEVIKASWRTLLGRLRQHPDLGGGHVRAQALNAAWAVLGSAELRAAYDRQRRLAAAAAGVTAGVAAVMAAVVAAEVADTPFPWPQLHCPLCQHRSAARLHADSRCSQCHSPLATLPAADHQGHELLGRRGAVRRDQSHVALVHVGWPSPALPVRWRDLSLTGLSFYAPRPLRSGQRLRLVDSALEGVVEVVGCRAQGRVFTVHARLLTALLLQATGVFVSAQA